MVYWVPLPGRKQSHPAGPLPVTLPELGQVPEVAALSIRLQSTLPAALRTGTQKHPLSEQQTHGAVHLIVRGGATEVRQLRSGHYWEENKATNS